MTVAQPWRDADLAVTVARDYLESVTVWLADRSSFGAPLIDHPVLRQRLTWGVVALATADAALAALSQADEAACAAAIAAADQCVRSCEEVHAAAGIFDPRPGTVRALFARRPRRTPDDAAITPPSGLSVHRLADDRLAKLSEDAKADAHSLAAELEHLCPSATATLPEELAVAEALAGHLRPGPAGRILAHRNITANFPTRSGTRLGLTALAVTEPHTGTDLANLTSRLRQEGPTRVLDAAKIYVTGGADCDALLVAAQSPSGIRLVWVDPARPGVTREPLRGRAWRGGAFAKIEVHGYPVSDEALHPGDGISALLRALARERLMVAGLQLAYARRWSAEMARVVAPAAGGLVAAAEPAPLSVLRHDLVDRIAACRALVRQTASVPGEPSLVQASMAKLACCQLAAEFADLRLELLSAAGGEPSVAELVDDQADARAATVAGGTADLNLAIVEGKLTALLSTRSREGDHR